MRHIIVVDTATRWRVVHPKGFGDGSLTPGPEHEGCREVQRAAEIFMAPLPALLPPPRSSLRLRIRWAFLTARAYLFPILPVLPGAYWVEVVDGNLHIGGRLPAASAFAYAGDLR